MIDFGAEVVGCGEGVSPHPLTTPTEEGVWGCALSQTIVRFCLAKKASCGLFWD